VGAAVKYSNSVQVRDAGPLYEPTEKERRKNMARLANDAIRGVIAAKLRELPESDELPTSTLHEECHRQALLALLDLGMHSEKDSDRIAALAKIGELRIAEMRLMADLRDENEAKAAPAKVVVVNAADISRLSEMQRQERAGEKR
jgi:hypothetical protein